MILIITAPVGRHPKESHPSAKSQGKIIESAQGSTTGSAVFGASGRKPMPSCL